MRVAPNPTTEKKRHPSITPHDNGSRDWTDTPKSQGSLRPVGSKQHPGRGKEGLSSRAFRESAAQPPP